MHRSAKPDRPAGHLTDSWTARVGKVAPSRRPPGERFIVVQI